MTRWTRWQLAMEWEKVRSKRLPGYGRCIYCGSDGGKEGLRDEHVIPFALGGRIVIEGGSCRDCARKIAPVDTHLGRSVYGEHRIHVDAPTSEAATVRFGVTPDFFGERPSTDLSPKCTTKPTIGFHPICEKHLLSSR